MGQTYFVSIHTPFFSLLLLVFPPPPLPLLFLPPSSSCSSSPSSCLSSDRLFLLPLPPFSSFYHMCLCGLAVWSGLLRQSVSRYGYCWPTSLWSVIVTLELCTWDVLGGGFFCWFLSSPLFFDSLSIDYSHARSCVLSFLQQVFMKTVLSFLDKRNQSLSLQNKPWLN